MSAEPAPRRYLVTVYGRLPVLNELLRMHRMQRHAMLTSWKEWTAFHLMTTRVPPLERVRISCTRYAPGTRQADADGLAGGFKPVLDALMSAGVVSNDDQAHVTATYAAKRCPANEARVELVIEEMG